MWTSGISLRGYELALVGGYWKMKKLASQGIENVLQEIEGALNARLYYLAVAMALTLPDICAALESSDGVTSPTRYKAWFDSYMAKNIPSMTATDCYSLRCGVVHQGRFGHEKMRYGRAIFLLPNEQNIHFSDCMIDDAFFYSADIFCHRIIKTARDWFEAKKADPNVQKNLPNLVQLRPDGLAPYVQGAIIA